jgi:hypothetical protein
MGMQKPGRAAAAWCSIVIVAVVSGCGQATIQARASSPYMLADNSLNMNGLVANGVLANGLRMNGLRMNGLRMNGLRMNGLSINDLSQDDSLNLMYYIVSCAAPPPPPDDPTRPALTLWIGPEGFEIPYTFMGDLGLVPNFTTDGVADNDVDGQQRLTACLMARSNSKGNHVQISLRMPGMIGYTQDEYDSFYIFEATYAGNLFPEGGSLEACLWDENFGGITDIFGIGNDLALFAAAGRDCAVSTTAAACGFTAACTANTQSINAMQVWDSLTVLASFSQ